MANIVTKTYDLNITPGGVRTLVNLSQYENGRQLVFRLVGDANISIPSGSTAVIEGTKPDGNVYSGTGTVDAAAGTVTFQEEVQMTAVAGEYMAKVKVLSGSQMVASGIITMLISMDPVSDGAVESDSDVQGLIAEARQVYEGIQNDLNSLDTEVDVLSARMDTFAQLPSGSTSGNAELVDIRVGANGTTYPTAGDAVRGQINNINSALFGGRFTLPVVYTSGGYIQEFSPGNVVSYSGWKYTDYIDIRNSDGLLYCALIDQNGNQVSDGNNYNAFYNENKEYISNLSTINGAVQVPNGAFYVRLSCRSTYTQQIAITVTGIENAISEVDGNYITITTWNVGLFKDGTHRPTEAEAPGQIANFLRTIGKCNADIINMQEYAYYVGSNNTYESMHLIDFKYPYERHYPGTGTTKTGSKYETSEITRIIFNSGSNRECYYCDINVKGKTITLINAHLSIERDPSAHRNADIAQLIEFMNTRDYVILTGDFNVASDAEFDAFKSAGYTLCNGGAFGWFDTWPVRANMWEGFTTDWPCYHLDNIIVTSNIIPQYVECVESKISDHAPLLAVLKIN